MAARPGSRTGSIRTRIVFGYVALLAFAVVVTAVAVRSALLAQFDGDVDGRLASEVEQLERYVDEGDPETADEFRDPEVLFDSFLRTVLPGDDGAFYTLVGGEPHLFSFGAPADLLDDRAVVEEWRDVVSSDFSTLSTVAGRARSLTVPVVLPDGEGTFVAVEFTDDGRRRLGDVMRTLLVVALGVLVASGFVAAMVANRIVAPIRHFTSVAGRVDDDDLTARVATNEGPGEIRELAATFNAMLDRLEAGFAAQRRFLDDAAHDLRTPITIIRGHLDVHARAPTFDEVDPTPDTGLDTELLVDELDRMSRYVDDLLLLAQAERPDFVRPEPVELDELVDSLFIRVAELGPRTWRLDHEPSGVTLRLDPQRIDQAVLNLAQNAVRHTDVGDEIALTVSWQDGDVLIGVRDTGPGVDPEVADAVFDRHVRSVASRTAGGLGIGLSIVDAIAEAHGGRVEVESSDSGSHFVIRLEVLS